MESRFRSIPNPWLRYQYLADSTDPSRTIGNARVDPEVLRETGKQALEILRIAFPALEVEKLPEVQELMAAMVVAFGKPGFLAGMLGDTVGLHIVDDICVTRTCLIRLEEKVEKRHIGADNCDVAPDAYQYRTIRSFDKAHVRIPDMDRVRRAASELLEEIRTTGAVPEGRVRYKGKTDWA